MIGVAASKLLLVIAPAANGAATTIVLYLLDVAFWKSMALALVSAIISGAFLLVSTVIVTREARLNREKIGEVRQEQVHVKRALEGERRVNGPGRRASDDPTGSRGTPPGRRITDEPES